MGECPDLVTQPIVQLTSSKVPYSLDIHAVFINHYVITLLLQAHRLALAHTVDIRNQPLHVGGFLALHR